MLARRFGYFLGISIILLMSLNAIGQPNISSECVIPSTPEQQECLQNPVPEVHEQSCKKIANADKLQAPYQDVLASEKVNLSFNFIYYILFKFKYIDIFELLK